MSRKPQVRMNPVAAPLRPRQRGATLVEVLVTVVILVFGLVGLVGLQARMQISEMESYQRSQALLLVQDMSNRLSANRAAAASYVGDVIAGSCPSSTGTTAETDLRQWCLALEGAAETQGGVSVGALIGGRGCIEAAGSGYRVSLAWQGLAAIAEPAATCGQGAYKNASNAVCEACRRVVSTLVRIPSL